MSVHLLGLGTARPDHAIGREESVRLAVRCSGADSRRARTLRTLYRRTRVDERGCALLHPGDGTGWFYRDPRGGGGDRGPTTDERMRQFRRLAPDLAARASTAALDDAALDPRRVTHLVVATCTGFASPGVEVALITRLGLAPDVVRVQIGFMGCHAALNALQVASTIARADGAARVLVACVELCSLHLQYGWDAQQLVANALFADGAAAFLVGRTETAHRGQWRVREGVSRFIAGTEDRMSWHIGDHGFRMTLSPRVPQTIADHLRPWLDDWLAVRGLAVDGIGSWAVHAGGPRIVQAVADRLALAPAAVAPSLTVLRRCGNMSSATVPFILAGLRGDDAPLPCVALSFGPGLVAEAALLDRAAPGSSP
jgi:predicted naringenin-chalcone synthase